MPLSLPNPRRREELRREFQQAMAALQQPERAAAGRETLLACVVADPGNGIFVESFLRELRRLSPQPRSMLSRWLAAWQRSGFTGDWQRDWSRLWKQLLQAPQQVELPRQLAVLAQEANLSEVEAHLRRYAVAVAMREPAAEEWIPLRELAWMLVRHGSLEEAASLWQKIIEHVPDDPAASRFRAAWTQQVPPWARALPPELENSPFYRSFLASLSEAEFITAQQQLQDFGCQQGNPAWLAEWQEELFLFRAKHAVEVAKRLHGDPLVPTTDETSLHLQNELSRRELEIFSRRGEQQPQQTEWQWEAALRMKKLANYSGAIQALEALCEQPPWQAAARLELAECWQRLRQFEKALAYYAEVLEREPTDATIRERALSQGTRLAAAMGKNPWPASEQPRGDS